MIFVGIADEKSRTCQRPAPQRHRKEVSQMATLEDPNLVQPAGSGNGGQPPNTLAAIARLKREYPGLMLREAKAVIDGDMSLVDALKTIRSEPDAPPLIRSSATPSRAALQRRYTRLLVEVAQVVARKPAGSGKRQRGRIAQAAECLAELREVTARLRQV
jgi:hypothetical protein